MLLKSEVRLREDWDAPEFAIHNPHCEQYPGQQSLEQPEGLQRGTTMPRIPPCLLFAAAAALLLASGAQAARWREAFAPAPAPGPEPDGNSTAACPPPDFDALPELNVSEYISEKWYVLAQTPLVYQPRSQLFCVTAQYVPLNPEDPLDGLQVINYSNQLRVNGPALSTGSGPSLIATVPDRSQPSKLSVGFDFPSASQLVGTQFGAGPYWVVAVGEDGYGGYDWAIVVSGEPSVPGSYGCLLAEEGVAGIWLFSRRPDGDPDHLRVMMDVLDEMGVDPSVLVPVEQEGCTYDSA